jgi:hypothetical protein
LWLLVVVVAGNEAVAAVAAVATGNLLLKALVLALLIRSR